MNAAADFSNAHWTAQIINGSADLPNANGHKDAAAVAKKAAEAKRKRDSRVRNHYRKGIERSGPCVPEKPRYVWIGDMISGEWKPVTQLSNIGDVHPYGTKKGFTLKDAIIFEDDNKKLGCVQYNLVMRTPHESRQCYPKTRGLNSKDDLAVVGKIMTGECFSDGHADGGFVRVKWANGEQDWRRTKNLVELTDNHLGYRKQKQTQRYIPGSSEGAEYIVDLTHTSISKVGSQLLNASFSCAHGDGATAKDALGKGKEQVKKMRERDRLRNMKKLLQEMNEEKNPWQQRINGVLAKLNEKEKLVEDLEKLVSKYNDQRQQQRKQQKLLLEMQNDELLLLQAEEGLMQQLITELLEQQLLAFSAVELKFSEATRLEKRIDGLKKRLKVPRQDKETKKYQENQLEQDTKKLDDVLGVSEWESHVHRPKERDRLMKELEQRYKQLKKWPEHEHEFGRVLQQPNSKKLGSGEHELIQELLQLNLNYERFIGSRNDAIPNFDEAIDGKGEEEEDRIVDLTKDEIIDLTKNDPTNKETGEYLRIIGYLVQSRHQAEGKAAKDQKKAEGKPRSKCKEKGCDKLARTGGYCMRHGETQGKMCKKCNKRTQKKLGGLCRHCFSDEPGDSTPYCAYCKAIPTKRAGWRCEKCIIDNRKVEKLCSRCNINKPHRKGGICDTCFKKMKGEEQSCKKRKFM